MRLPGFSAEASLGAKIKEYGTHAVVRAGVRSLVTPQGCPPWVAVGCVAAIAACVASCAAGPEACIACFAGIGASNCLSCVQ
jgi:hypothetical protein